MKNRFLKITVCSCILTVITAVAIGGCTPILPDSEASDEPIYDRTTPDEEIGDWKTAFTMMEEQECLGSYVEGTLLSYIELTQNTDFDLMTVYDYETVSERLDWDKFRFNSSRYLLQFYHEDFPIERIEAIDDRNVCVVYKLEDDQHNIVYAYVVFDSTLIPVTESENQPAITSPDETTSVVTEEVKPEVSYAEAWFLTWEIYYVLGEFSYSDYASIEVGDSYEKFAAVDPAVKYDYEKTDSMGSVFSDGSCGFRSLRLLKDGLLVVEFEDPDLTLGGQDGWHLSAAEKHSVKSMQFYPWGTGKVLEYLNILNAEADSIEFPN